MKALFYKPFFYVVLITVLGSFLRFYHLDFKSLWLDEAVIYLNAQGTLAEILEKNATDNSAPPTFTLLVRVVMFLGGSEFWLRLPSCLAGIAAIPLAFICFRRFSDDWGAMFGALLIAAAPTQILYSQQVREYSIVVCLTLGLFTFFFDCIHRRTTGSFLLFSLTAAVAIGFQYGMLFVIAGLLGVLLIYLLIHHRQRIPALLVSLLPIVLSALLVYWIALRHQFQFRTGVYLEDAYAGPLLCDWPGFFLKQTTLLFQFCTASSCYPLLLVMVMLGIVGSFVQKHYLAVISALSLFAVVIAANMLSAYPYGPLRQVIFLTVPVYLVASFGAHYVFQHAVKSIYVIIAVLICLWGTEAGFYYLQQESRYNMKPTAQIWETELLNNDHIFVSLHSTPAFYYYFPELKSRSIAVYPHYYDSLESLEPEHDAAIVNRAGGRVWMLFSLYDSDYVEQMLDILRSDRDVRCVSDANDLVRLYLVSDLPDNR